MRSLTTHLLAAIVGAVIAFAWPSGREPAPTPARDRLPATEPEARVSISPAAPAVTNTQAMPYRVIPIDVDGSANELTWCRALQAVIGGELEYRVGKGPSYGRVDLLTAEFAVEVDWISNWQAGIGQALHYAHETGKAPELALALKEKRGVFRGDREECEYVASLCAKHGIAVWVLHVEP